MRPSTRQQLQAGTATPGNLRLPHLQVCQPSYRPARHEFHSGIHKSFHSGSHHWSYSGSRHFTRARHWLYCDTRQ